jgi:hypothetical protein
MWTHTCTCTHTRMHAGMHAHVHTHTHARARAHTHNLHTLMCFLQLLHKWQPTGIFFTKFGQVLQCVVLCVVCHGLSHPNIPWLLGYQPRPTLVAWLPTCMNCGCLVTPVHGHITGWGILRLDMPRLQVSVQEEEVGFKNWVIGCLVTQFGMHNYSLGRAHYGNSIAGVFHLYPILWLHGCCSKQYHSLFLVHVM